MAFSNFTLPSAVEHFGLTLTSQPLFPGVPPVDAGHVVHQTLKMFGQLALGINTEKARSEWLIAPVVGELWLRGKNTIYVLSGVEFTVDKDEGLTGVVDFMIGRGPQVSFVPSCPILAVVEAKNESIPGGQGQCAAEMVAALRFNRAARNDIGTVFGVVTTGTTWRFHRLHDSTFAVDIREYLISEVDQILGILMHIVGLIP